MNFHKDPGDSLEPCKHMESMLNRTADGSAPKLMSWYARNHAAGCTRCGNFLTRVTALIGHLRQMKEPESDTAPVESLSKDRWDSIEASWVEAEK